MNEIRTISLDRLRFGHEADPPINARKIGREDDIESLAASIVAHGLGQALNVKEIDGEVYVADGNRRLAALRLNAERGRIASDEPINCSFRDDDYDADELSLALNIERVPMHEADQYEKFHEFRARGMTEEQIAGRFGIEPVRVRRMIAIGRLHPVILDAWRNDEFQRPIETVRAFTMAPSQKAQKEVYDRLNKKGQLSPNWVREAFGAGNREAAKLLIFVGRDAYLAAGGKIIEDLFGEDHAISNFDLVRKLADARIEREKKVLVDAGWAWAEESSDLPQSWNYSWQKISPRKLDNPSDDEAAEIKSLKKVLGKTSRWERSEEQQAAAARLEDIETGIRIRSYSDSERKKAGAAVSIGMDGHLHVTYGLVKPAAPKKEKSKAGEPAAPATISNAMMERLSVQLTAAAKQAIVANRHTALAALVAGLACSTYGIPVRIKAEGLLREGRQVESFSEVFDRLRAISDADLMQAAAHEVSFCLDLQRHHADQPPFKTPMFLNFCEALEADALQDALRQHFDAEDYFKMVPRAFTEAAIGEAINEDEARKAAKLKKGELVAFAVKNVPPTGWLPVELRTSTYAGPAKSARKQAA
ncbi:MAG: ParB/RepB/Spo0J family partition protein [Devosia sp.]|nr:ParB/RepB/Spo0J family partition protein [Devosia sp.]